MAYAAQSIAQPNNDGSMTISMSRGVYDALSAYAQRMEDAGVSPQTMGRLGKDLVKDDGTINLRHLVHAARAVETDRAYAAQSGHEYRPNQAVDEIVDEADQPATPSFGKKAIAAGALAGIGLLAATAAADITYQRPAYDDVTQTWNMSAYDDDAQNGFFYGLKLGADKDQNFLGDGLLTFANPGQESRESYDFGFIESSLQLPGGWTSSYDPTTNILDIIGNVNPGDSYNINFTFDPQDVILGRTDFNYEGFATQGTMPNVDTLSYDDQVVVPVPGSGLLALLGIGSAIIGKRRMRDAFPKEN